MADAQSPKSESSTKILPPTANKTDRKVTLWDLYQNASIFSKIFLFASTLHAIGLLIVGFVALGWPNVDDVYAALSIYVGIFFFWFMLEGVLKENTLQLIFSVLSSVLITIYLIWFYYLDPHDIVAYLAFTSIAFCVGYMVLSPFLINNFGWYRYNKSQTTNTEVMDMYYLYQKMESFVLLDVEISIIFAILVTDRLEHNILGYIGNFSSILFEVAWAVVGIRAVRTEHELITKCFMAATILLWAYIIVNCYWITNDSSYDKNTTNAQFFLTGSGALIVRCFVLFWTYRAMQNFNKGLRVFFDEGSHNKDFWGDSNAKLLSHSENENDMEAANDAGMTFESNNNAKLNDGLSSRSRINSSDFD